MADNEQEAELQRRRAWDADRVIADLAHEQSAFRLTEEQLAAKLLKEALPLAVASVVHLSQFGETEKMRFDASKYLIDRNLGTPTKEGDLAARELDPMEQLLQECTEYVAAQDSTGSSSGGSA